MFITTREELERLIQQEPLIAREPSIEGTKDLEIPTSLYFGIGLCNRHSVSQGLPIDVLSIVLMSERVGTDKCILIADTHAKSNGFDWQEIDRVAKQNQETLYRVCENLALPRWGIVTASSIDQAREYQEILNSINEENEYVRRELADIEWFRQNKGTRLKAGWSLNGNRDSSETFFDKKYKELFSDEMSFLYLEPGRTFDPKKPKSIPYFCEDTEARIVLDRAENIEEKFRRAKDCFGEQGVRTYQKFLNHLVRLYDSVIEPTERGPTEYRVQQIVERCLK